MEKDVTCVDLFHFRLFQTISVLIIIVNLRYDENVNADKIIDLYTISPITRSDYICI